MNETISITAIGSVSPLGYRPDTIWGLYQQNGHLFTERDFGAQKALNAVLSDEAIQLVQHLRNSDPKYKSLDNTVLYAMAASRLAIVKAGWGKEDSFGINIGSSRGATQLFEEYHRDFIENGKAHTLSSPTTTLGNISSWVAHDLQSEGPEISHSITCSTALHAVLNGVAWLRAGMANKFLVGGSEAPLTPFTIAQMKALKIYGQPGTDYPCRALDLDKKRNSMLLGEGAGVACLEIGKSANALAYISGIGYATEILQHNISISAEADCFQKSMQMALLGTDPETIDCIVMHAPGTIKGDLSEYKAITKVFGDKQPLLTSNKWKIGHTFGASGILSIEMALFMMAHQEFIGIPFIETEQKSKKEIRKVLVNAVGFGGNAVSIVLEMP